MLALRKRRQSTFLIFAILGVLFISLIHILAVHAATGLAHRTRVVISGLQQPWAVVPSPDGEIWITEKGGAIKIFSRTYKLLRTLTGLPDLVTVGEEGGLLDLAFHPKFKTNGQVYVAYSVIDPNTAASPGGRQYFTQINRFTYRGGSLQDRKVIYDGPASTFRTHFGCRLLFDEAGYLFASFGERRQSALASDPQTKHGKIVRLTAEGEIPADNPFGPMNPNYSIGHRNPQGLAIHPINRRIYESEHGPSGYDVPADAGTPTGGGDEINEIKVKGDYGWPNSHHDKIASGTVAPLKVTGADAIAPSGIEFYTGSKLPGWKGDLFVATLRGQHLLRLRIDASGALLEEEALL